MHAAGNNVPIRNSVRRGLRTPPAMALLLLVGHSLLPVAVPGGGGAGLAVAQTIVGGRESLDEVLRRLEKEPRSSSEAERLATVCLDAVKRTQSSAADLDGYLEVCRGGKQVAKKWKHHRLALSLGRYEARCLEARDETDEAEHVLRRLIVQYAKHAPVTQAHLQLADLLRDGGDWEQAIEALDEAEASLRGWRDRLRSDAVTTIEGQILGERFELAMSLGLSEQAGHWLARQHAALDSLKRPERFAVESYSRNRLRWLVETHRVDEATSALDSRYPARSSDGSSRAVPTVVSLWRAQNELRRAEVAASRLDGTSEQEIRLVAAVKALQERLDSGDLSPDLTVEPLLHLAWHHAVRGDLERSAALHERALVGFESLRERVAYPEASRRAVYLDAARSRWARAGRELGKDLMKPHELRKLVETFDKKYRDFVRTWSSARRGDGKGEALEAGFLDHAEHRRLVGELIDLILVVDGSATGIERAFRVLLHAQMHGKLALDLGIDRRSFDPDRIALDAVRELLVDAEGMLLYLFAPGATHLFVLDDLSLRHESVAHGDLELLSRRNRLVETHSGPSRSATAVEDIAALRDALLPAAVIERLTSVPVAASEDRGTDGAAADTPASWRCLTIVGDEQLGWLPMSMLLPETVPVAYLPSIPVGLRLLSLRPTRPLRTAVFVSGWKNHHTEAWSTRYRTTWAPWPGEEALADADVLHLTAHAVWSPGDGPLTIDLQSRPFGVAQAVALPRVPPYVVLAICRTEGAPETERAAGERRSAWSRAMLAGGACAVLLSPVDVETGPTLALMNILHREMALGRGPARALVTARAELAGRPVGIGGSARPDNAASGRWFRVVGLGHRP